MEISKKRARFRPVLVWLVLSVAVVGIYLSKMSVHWRESSWPTATAAITAISSKDVLVRTKNGANVGVELFIGYSYIVNGTPFMGTRFSSDSPSLQISKDKEATLLAQYAVGKSIAIRYEPQRPSISVILPSRPWWLSAIAVPILLSLLTGIVIRMWIYRHG